LAAVVAAEAALLRPIGSRFLFFAASRTRLAMIPLSKVKLRFSLHTASKGRHDEGGRKHVEFPQKILPF
jgi:hypothetical protein